MLYRDTACYTWHHGVGYSQGMIQSTGGDLGSSLMAHRCVSDFLCSHVLLLLRRISRHQLRSSANFQNLEVQLQQRLGAGEDTTAVQLLSALYHCMHLGSGVPHPTDMEPAVCPQCQICCAFELIMSDIDLTSRQSHDLTPHADQFNFKVEVSFIVIATIHKYSERRNCEASEVHSVKTFNTKIQKTN